MSNPVADTSLDPWGIFQYILDTRSLTVIHYASEEHLEVVSPEEKVALEAILDTNSLDIAWAIANEQLGRTEEAARLREWVANKSRRRHTDFIPAD